MSRRRRTAKVALGSQVLAVLLAVAQIRPVLGEPGAVLSTEVPIVGGEPPKARELKDGDASVSTQTGAFQYAYPIEVPPGRLGMQPNLALKYSSQAPLYGGVAAGWSLELPQITWDLAEGILKWRQSDGSYAPPFVSSMAGGHRLRAVTETALPDVLQTYRAEDDSSYARYERLAGGQWRVRTPDGMTHFFNEPSHILDPNGVPVASGEARRAPLTRTVDAFNNTVEYYWRQLRQGGSDDAYPVEVIELDIDHIDYTANDPAGVAYTPPFARVSFDYLPTLQRCTGTYLPIGASLSMRDHQMSQQGSRQLQAIRSGLLTGPAGSQTFTARRTVGLAYESVACSETHGTTRQLATITESAISPVGIATSKPPVTFTYGPNVRDFARRASMSSGFTPDLQSGKTASATPYVNASWPTLDYMLIDLDGDGRTDRVSMTSGGTSLNWERNQLDASGNQSFEPQFGTIPLPVLPPITSTQPNGNPWPPAYSSQSVAGQVVSAMNNDSPAPLVLQWDNGSGAPQEQVCEDRGNQLTFLPYRFLDMNADGLPDLVTTIKADPLWYQPYPSFYHPGHPELLAAWEMGPCQTFPEYTADDNAVPVLDPLAVDEAVDCSDERVDVCAFDQAKVTADMAAAPTTSADALDGGWTVTHMTHHPTGSTVWTDIFGISHEGSPPMAPPGGSFSCGGDLYRVPTMYCKRYPWRWYPNLGNGQFAGLTDGQPLNGNTILSPIPLEPSGEGLSLGGRGNGFSSAKHAIIDIDGDGYLDAVLAQNTEDEDDIPETVSHTGWFVWRGDASGRFWTDPATDLPYLWLVPRATHLGVSISDVTNLAGDVGVVSQLADMNSDGLPDLVRKKTPTTPLEVYFNSGDGFRGGPLALGPSGVARLPSTLETVHHSDTDRDGLEGTPAWSAGERADRLFTMDLDLDGRSDVINRGTGSESESPITAFVSMGNGAGQAASNGNEEVMLTLPSHIVEALPQKLSTDGESWSVDQEAVDLDGDGAVDLAESGSPIEYWTDLKDGKPNRLLNRIDRGTGALIDVRYATQSDPAVRIPGATPGAARASWVVDTLTITNQHRATWPGEADPPPGDFGVATTRYRYGTPVQRPDNRGRLDFRGFAQVETTAPLGSRTLETYDFNVDWSGRLARTVVYPSPGATLEPASDAVDSIDTTTYEPRYLFGTAARSFVVTDTRHYTCSAGQVEAQCAPTAANPNPLPTVLQAQTTWNPYPSVAAARAYVQYEVRQTRLINAVALDDKRETYLTYVGVIDADNYRIRRKTTRKAEGNLNAQGQIQFQQYAEHIDDWDTTNGYRTISRTWDQFKSGSGETYLKTHFLYDWSGSVGTGVKLSVRKPNFATSPTIKTSFVYDANKAHVVSTTNELGHVVYTDTDLATGAVTSSRGPNGTGCQVASATCEETRTIIDGFGRPLSQYVSVDAASQTYDLQVAATYDYYDSQSPQRVRERKRLDWTTPEFVTSETTFDGLGQVMKKVDTVGGGLPDDVAVFRYDLQGKLVRVMAQDPSVSVGQAKVEYFFDYDPLGRLTGATRPAVGAGAPSGFTIARSGLVETRTEKGSPASGPIAQTVTKRDIFGRLIEVKEAVEVDPSGSGGPAGTSWATTAYDYDGFDNLLRVVSADGVTTTTLAYDLAGRRTGITRGTRTWQYQYDFDSNLTVEIAPIPAGASAAAYTTSIVYDALDRPTSRLAGVRALTAAEQG